MSDSELDRAVKGAPPPTVSQVQVAAAAARTSSPDRAHGARRALRNALLPKEPADPISMLPSSPPMIYLNLLILEASLRSQYLALRARRRVNSFFLFLLGLWLLYFNYAVFLRPREDGNGVGGSPYWVIDRGQKVACMGGWVTAILVKLTGQWEKGTRWPQRWLRTANRGLRVFNCKAVIIRGPWWSEMLSHISVVFPYSAFFTPPGSSYHFVDATGRIIERQPPEVNVREYKSFREEDIAPGGDHIKLVLMPKSFSAEFRQNWETYRNQYWEGENEHRARLRDKVRLRQRELAREQGLWIWWTGWRGWQRAKGLGGRGGDVEKSLYSNAAHGPVHSLKEREKKQRPSLGGDGSHSRSSSRSSTASTLDSDEWKPHTERRRRGSSSAGSSARMKTKPAAGSNGGGRVSKLTTSRPGTPTSELPPTLEKRVSKPSKGSVRLSLSPTEQPPNGSEEPAEDARMGKGEAGHAPRSTSKVRWLEESRPA